MNIAVVLQARMGSTRLPGKCMADLVGWPLLTHVIERAQAIPGIQRVIVATPATERDQVLLALARQWDAEAFAGSEEDVLDRYYQAVRHGNVEVIVRVTADCPLLDPTVSDRVLKRFLRGDVDYASNTLLPTFPDGLDTEVFTFAALERAWREASLASEREHVTPFIWKNPNRFRVTNVTNPVDLSSQRWTVDEPQDLEFVRAVFGRLYHKDQPIFGMEAVLSLLGRDPSLGQINAGLKRNEGYAKSLREEREIK